jgi:hypothetical protein
MAMSLLRSALEMSGDREMCPQMETLDGRKCTSRRTRLRGQEGAELVEAAFVISLLLMLLIGITWMARAYNTHETLTRAAREGARLAVTPSCATCGNTYPTDDEIRTVVEQILTSSSLNPSLMAGFTVTRGMILNPGSPPEERGVVVGFSYPFQFVMPFTSLHLTTLTLSAQVQMREE